MHPPVQRQGHPIDPSLCASENYLKAQQIVQIVYATTVAKTNNVYEFSQQGPRSLCGFFFN